MRANYLDTRIHHALLIAAILTLSIASFRGKTSVLDYFDLKESSLVLKDALNKIELDIERLRLEIKRIKESPSYAHKVLRDKYHITEEGESIIFFAD
ncbi:MAG: septum formation initiator family protein [Oligoflexales bacterium]|nr:septum formation initiator family protein [Oligoflexales bacterium]